MKIIRWMRSPAARPYTAVFLWVITAANVAWCTLDVRRRYDAVVQSQTFRMQCQVNGGSYGAIGDSNGEGHGEGHARTGCFRRASEAEAQETR